MADDNANGTSPEQRAYDAWHATRFPDSPPPGWAHPATEKARPAWEAAVRAAFPELVRERDEARAERDEYRTIACDAVGTDPGVYGSSSQAINRRALVSRWREQLGMGPL